MSRAPCSQRTGAQIGIGKQATGGGREEAGSSLRVGRCLIGGGGLRGPGALGRAWRASSNSVWVWVLGFTYIRGVVIRDVRYMCRKEASYVL